MLDCVIDSERSHRSRNFGVPAIGRQVEDCSMHLVLLWKCSTLTACAANTCSTCIYNLHVPGLKLDVFEVIPDILYYKD